MPNPVSLPHKAGSLSDAEYQKLVSHFRFSVRTVRYTDKKDHVHKIHTVILKNTDTGLPVCIMKESDIQYHLCDVTNASTMQSTAPFSLAGFMNFALIDNFQKYKARSLGSVTEDMVLDYIQAYASEKTVQTREKPALTSIITHRNAVCQCLDALSASGDMAHIRPGQLVRDIAPVSDGISMVSRSGRPARSYSIPIIIDDDRTDGLQRLQRDMPLELGERLVHLSEVYDPTLTFAIILMLYTGLRQGEICNVRRVDSPYGAGIIIQSIRTRSPDGTVIVHPEAISFDIRYDFPLRSDNKRLGDIKKNRPQPVCGVFNDTIYRYYMRHLELIKDMPCEDSKPMFLSRNIDRKAGVYRAMSASGLRGRLNTLFQDYLLPSCKDDPNDEIRLFWQEMQGHTWGGHGLRHWFSVNIILAGGVSDPTELMSFRGDKSLDSATRYLRGKKALMEKYKGSLDVLARMMKG